MKTAAIIAEYNPFHNGHLYHVQKTREFGYSHIIAIMSGNFMQRGTPAVVDRFLRARAAVQCGVDLVLELPLPWCSSAAQDFANGAVQIIKATGVVDALSFGCESTDLQLMHNAIELINKEENQNNIKNLIESGCSYPSAIAKALQATGNIQICEFLSRPNNMLGVEYCKNIFGSDIIPLPIQRIGCEHDDVNTFKDFASASHIRNSLYSNEDHNSDSLSCCRFLPEPSVTLLRNAIDNYAAPLDLNKFNLAAISRLRMLTEEDFSKLPFVYAGMQYRLFDSAQKALSFDQACDLAKNKHVTHARIRRTYLQAVLGLYKLPQIKNVPYIRVLAMNQQGRLLLKQMQNTTSIPILMRHADTAKLDAYGLLVYNFNQVANDFYNLCLPVSVSGGADNTRNIFIEK